MKVSGVPYEVNLKQQYDELVDNFERCEQKALSDIATLEQENKFMRARMMRLEDECREAQELVSRLNVELLNLRNKHNETFR